MKELNQQAKSLQDSIFSAISQKAAKAGAINLAQGFPDFDAPRWILDIAQRVFLEGKNQYSASMGYRGLRQSISEQYQNFYNLKFDIDREILVTNGATEAIDSTIRAVINPGDEVVVFEPFYDSYVASVYLAGGILKPVTLKAPDFSFDLDELVKAVTAKTKLLIFNNPHNPTGKVFTKEEKKIIADLAVKNDFYILSDEVYEFLSFQSPHQPLACIEEIKDRVITISSIGKSLSLTGWKIGWLCASENIIKAVHNVHQYACFCVATPLQATIAEVLQLWPDHVEKFRQEYTERKNLIVNGLKNLDIEVYDPQGTYFALAKVPDGLNDLQYCEKLISENKVAVIPISSFYKNSDEGKKLVRFCFAKNLATIENALNNLGK